MMRNSIVLIGAGSFGKEVCGYLQHDLSHNILTGFTFKGVLDDSKDNYDTSGLTIPYLGKINDFTFASLDYILIAIGNTNWC